MSHLMHLAHELAHFQLHLTTIDLGDQEHTVEHERLTTKIYDGFLGRLDDEGYISEEDEEKYGHEIGDSGEPP